MIRRSLAELHVAMLAGEPEAYTEFQDLTRDDILRMLDAMSLAPAEAEEVWNDAFLGTVRRMHREPPLTPLGESLRRYAFRAAQLAANSRFRAAKRRIDALSLNDQIKTPQAAAPNTEPTAVVRTLRSCIDCAPERVRQVAKLLLVSANAKQIAAALGVQEQSTYEIVRRAKVWLARCVASGGCDQATGAADRNPDRAGASHAGSKRRKAGGSERRDDPLPEPATRSAAG